MSRLSNLNAKFKLFRDRLRSVPYRYPLVLSEDEQIFLKKNFLNINTYLEFGAGGSTFICLMNSTATLIVSVESDPSWIDYMRKWRIIRKAEKTRLKFFPVNIGKVGDWGVPIETDKANLFPDYSRNVFEKFKDNDLIFIDGRFRVACAIQAVLNSSINTKILMHDYTDREYYHVIEQFLDIVEVVDTLVLFKIKPNVDRDQMLKLYEKYQYVSD